MIQILLLLLLAHPLTAVLVSTEFASAEFTRSEDSANDQFVWEMAHEIPRALTSNLLISPQSCWHALSLVYLGAEGSTRQDLEQVVNPFEVNHKAFTELLGVQRDFLSPQCSINSALFVSPKIPIRSEYQEALVTAGLSGIETVDFENVAESITTINSWVEGVTQGKIKQLVADSDIDLDTVSFLVSALHFKAPWQFPFRRESTKLEPFYTNTDVVVEVPMMRQIEYFNSASLDGFEYVSMPYQSEGQSEWEMELIRTPQCGLEDFSLGAKTLQDLRLQAQKKRLDIRLPRFKTSMRWDIRASMEKNGITIPFSDRADFSGISDAPLKIEKVYQECCLEVSEEGTEGAAATAIGFVSRKRREEPYIVVFDQPFYFLVREKVSGTILFFGLIENPFLD